MGLYAFVLQGVINRHGTRSWVLSNAEVLAAWISDKYKEPKESRRHDYEPKVIYSYSYKGKPYEGTEIWFRFDTVPGNRSTTAVAARTLESFAVGSRVPVWINPSRPWETALIENNGAESLAEAQFFGALGLIPVVIMAFLMKFGFGTLSRLGCWQWRLPRGGVRTVPTNEQVELIADEGFIHRQTARQTIALLLLSLALFPSMFHYYGTAPFFICYGLLYLPIFAILVNSVSEKPSRDASRLKVTLNDHPARSGVENKITICCWQLWGTPLPNECRTGGTIQIDIVAVQLPQKHNSKLPIHWTRFTTLQQQLLAKESLDNCGRSLAVVEIPFMPMNPPKQNIPPESIAWAVRVQWTDAYGQFGRSEPTRTTYYPFAVMRD